MKYTPYLILDLDGVFISMSQENPIKIDDFALSLHLLESWRKNNGKILIATNRTPAEMQPIAYFMGLREGFWITENGGSIYDVINQETIYPPEMGNYIREYIPLLCSHLGTNPSVKIHQTSGCIRTIIETPKGISRESYINSVILPLLHDFKYKEHFTVLSSKIISIEPNNLSKENALPIFFKKNGISPQANPLFFIADSDRDIGFAQKLIEFDAVIGAVGNSSPKFMDYVKQAKKGVCAPLTTSYHSSLIHLLKAFADIVEI